MTSSRKRPRSESDDNRAECPFSVILTTPKDKEQKKKKRRKTDGDDDDDGAKKHLYQISPFAPSGKFKSNETMDTHYTVDPSKKWHEMTRYNSFVLNGMKYYSEGFIFVANESTIERQKAVANKESLQPRKKSDDDWVARILEIRASDEHHVYARVYWMYWPDELPSNTHDGKKYVCGRQSYHGRNELIASNHMDIINVVSVTSPANVAQLIEDNDDEVQQALYWRQAIDVRTMELSTVEHLCKCGNPGNPDKTLIGCSDKSCNKWLHEDCLKHDTLMKTLERLGTDKPHAPPEAVKEEEKAKVEEAQRPLSPTETGAAVSAQQSIDVKVDGNDNVEVKRIEDEDAQTAPEDSAPPRSTSLPSAANDTPKTTPGRKPGRPRKKDVAETQAKGKPYEGLFEATLLMDLSPPMVEIKDLRENVPGGEKSWTEPIHCLVCKKQIN